MTSLIMKVYCLFLLLFPMAGYPLDINVILAVYKPVYPILAEILGAHEPHYTLLFIYLMKLLSNCRLMGFR
ncbi:hypothetical protein CI610_02454 [invertebrate metagenome]|uniref:Uncharacterized protein n=1 Tax=invertebrate metagenome TaxID=1711999 RepID=A0A2H9T5V2_9ZZZZ